jgi:hypothetical protein
VDQSFSCLWAECVKGYKHLNSQKQNTWHQLFRISSPSEHYLKLFVELSFGEKALSSAISGINIWSYCRAYCFLSTDAFVFIEKIILADSTLTSLVSLESRETERKMSEKWSLWVKNPIILLWDLGLRFFKDPFFFYCTYAV